MDQKVGLRCQLIPKLINLQQMRKVAKPNQIWFADAARCWRNYLRKEKSRYELPTTY
jgi:hypothetical protein